MALHRPEQLDLATARQILLAKKDLGGAVLKWQLITTASGRPTGGERMKHEFEVLGCRLNILARSNGFGGHQFILRDSNAAGNLARLCDDSAHNHELHWHYFEDMAGLDEETATITPPLMGGGSIDHSSLFVDVFAPGLNVDQSSYSIQGGML